MLDWLRLIRASGLFTIASNLTAAAACAAFTGTLDPREIARLVLYGNATNALWVVLCSCLLFASGMLWNDLADLDRDRELHPRRPLPSGRVGIAAAYVVGAFCAVGALLAAIASDAAHGHYARDIPPYAFYTAGVVLSLALLYDFLTKHVPWLGSLTMASVRLVHALFALLLLGVDHFKMAWFALLGIGDATLSASAPAQYALLLGLYVFGVTLVSELESRNGRRWELVLGGLLMVTAVLLGGVRLVTAHWITGLQISGGYVQLVASLFLGLAIIGLWGWRVLTPWLAALRAGRRGMVGPVVGAALGGMVLFDALLATTAHPLAGLLLLLVYPVFRLASRAIRMD